MPDRPFVRRGVGLHCDGVPLAVIADRFGTPTFVYSADAMLRRAERLRTAFAAADGKLAYSVKANSNGAILRLFERAGLWFDIVSGGELARVLATGATGDRIVYAGVGKTDEEMAAALDAGVRAFNVESPAEAARLDAVARSRNTTAPVALRVNPDVDAKTHAYITTGKDENKFGMSLAQARALLDEFMDLKNLRVEGVHAHIGSQITSTDPHATAAKVVDGFLDEVAERGFAPRLLNFGGGFGISYTQDGEDLDVETAARPVVELARRRGLELVLEPGRYIIGPAGALLTSVLYVKETESKTFVIVDGAMTELIRPSLYGAHHDIEVVVPRDRAPEQVDLVGPVCESADFFRKDVAMPRPDHGDLVAILDAGAYASVMASSYNSRPRAAEVLVADGDAHLISRRETVEELTRFEVLPEFLRATAGTK